MSNRNPARFAIIACLALVLALAGAANAAPQLSSHLEVDKAWLGEQDDVVVRFTLTNEGSEKARVPAWQTPLRGIDNNLFAVGLNGERVAYTGRLVKRAAPTAQDYITLAPGQSITTRVELSSSYDLGLPGEYTIQYRGILEPFSAKAAVQATSNETSFYRDGDLGKALLLRQLQAEAEEAAASSMDKYVTPTYVSCSTSRKNSIASALSQAQTYADNAYNYLTAGTAGTRYTRWFGTYNSSRYSTVRSHFTSIRNAVRNTRITFNCSCTDNYYAYVYPNSPYTVYLCNVFWSAPTGGTDSKAGTIIHELSHFNVLGGTDDRAYGQSACRSLATSSPSGAVDNADSHEYFAENTPFYS